MTNEEQNIAIRKLLGPLSLLPNATHSPYLFFGDSPVFLALHYNTKYYFLYTDPYIIGKGSLPEVFDKLPTYIKKIITFNLDLFFENENE